jgi:hypothetical protein
MCNKLLRNRFRKAISIPYMEVFPRKKLAVLSLCYFIFNFKKKAEIYNKQVVFNKTMIKGIQNLIQSST